MADSLHRTSPCPPPLAANLATPAPTEGSATDVWVPRPSPLPVFRPPPDAVRLPHPGRRDEARAGSTSISSISPGAEAVAIWQRPGVPAVVAAGSIAAVAGAIFA